MSTGAGLPPRAHGLFKRDRPPVLAAEPSPARSPWKAAGILDVRDAARGNLSPMIAEAVRESRAFARGLGAVAS